MELVVEERESEEPFSLPGFPMAYTGSLKITFFTSTNTTVLFRNVSVDVANQREHVDFDALDAAVSFYNKNISYWLSTFGSRLQCLYYHTVGTLNNSVTFPNVLSYAPVGTRVVNGVQCTVSQGNTCLEISGAPMDSSQSNPPAMCSNYSYYAQTGSYTPVRLELANPGTPQHVLLAVDYSNITGKIDNSSFNLPPPSSCSAYQSCNVTCAPPTIRPLFNIPFCNISLIPSWLLAVVIGLGCAHAVITKLVHGVVGRVSYSITFTAYAFMITSGFVVHCVFLAECGRPPSDPNAYGLWLLIDEGMTSSIALSFFFNGLIDLKILSEANSSTYALMLASYVLIFYAYIATTISPEYLYTYLIAITCGGYVLMQVVVLLRRGSFHGFGWAIAAGIAGAVGLIIPQHFYCWFCQHFGQWILEPFWYYLSDLSVFLIFCFVMATRDPEPAEEKREEKKDKGEIEVMKRLEGANGSRGDVVVVKL